MRSPTGCPGISRTHWQSWALNHILTKPRHPWQNGKAERFNRTLQEGWAYRQPFASKQTRTDALQPWLNFYNNHRPHGSL
jgi:transposase InsO family protein